MSSQRRTYGNPILNGIFVAKGIETPKTKEFRFSKISKKCPKLFHLFIG
jgi:hypothetical protein